MLIDVLESTVEIEESAGAQTLGWRLKQLWVS
jgi:hypothetical protein